MHGRVEEATPGAIEAVRAGSVAEKILGGSTGSKHDCRVARTWGMYMVEENAGNSDVAQNHGSIGKEPLLLCTVATM